MAYFHTNVLDNQIKALPTVSTASGSVATFDTDLTENLIEVVCDIQYSQASGTPTPSDPLPITTFSEMNVYATGKNLFDGQLPDISSTIKYRQIKLGNGTYTMSTDCPLNTANASNLFFFGGYATSGASTTTNGVYLNKPRTVTTTDGYITVAYRSASGVNPTNYTFQIEKGSYDTTYEAFGNTYNIPFGQTVAKGFINVTTGKLEITHLYQLFTGDNSEAWTSSPSGGHYRYLISRGDLVVGQIAKSNLFECVETSGQADNYKFYIGNSYVTFYYDDATTLAAWRTFLSNNNLQLVGELTTPLTVQLDSITLQALLNENNIWCDTGDTSVKYILSVGKAIS